MKVRRRTATILVVLAGTIVAETWKAVPTAFAQTDELIVACSPDHLIAKSGETVRLRAWVGPDAAELPRYSYKWTASTGRIGAAAATAEWDLGEALEGPARATVAVLLDGNFVQECSVQITVHRRDRSLSLDPVRSVLLPDQKETEGFGLYSYLLFGAEPPNEAIRGRYLAAISEYWRLVPEVEGFAENRDSAGLNIIHIPLLRAALPKASPEWVLEQYDYESARILLSKIPGWHSQGPYLISFRSRLSDFETVSHDVLFQDLSHVPPKLIAPWIREFVFQGARNEYWKPRVLQRLALELRTTISILSIAYPDVRKGLKSWISLLGIGGN